MRTAREHSDATGHDVFLFSTPKIREHHRRCCEELAAAGADVESGVCRNVAECKDCGELVEFPIAPKERIEFPLGPGTLT